MLNEVINILFMSVIHTTQLTETLGLLKLLAAKVEPDAALNAKKQHY